MHKNNLAYQFAFWKKSVLPFIKVPWCLCLLNDDFLIFKLFLHRCLRVDKGRDGGS